MVRSLLKGIGLPSPASLGFRSLWFSLGFKEYGLGFRSLGFSLGFKEYGLGSNLIKVLLQSVRIALIPCLCPCSAGQTRTKA